VEQLSLERVLKTLAGFGLTRTEAEVYVYLAREGSQITETTAESLSLNERAVSRILDSLLEKGIVSRTSEKSAIFSALPFEKAIDLLVKLHLEETRILEQNRDEIVSQWNSCVKKEQAK